MFSVLYTCEFKRIFFFLKEGRKEGIFVTKRVVFFCSLVYIFHRISLFVVGE